MIQVMLFWLAIFILFEDKEEQKNPPTGRSS